MSQIKLLAALGVAGALTLGLTSTASAHGWAGRGYRGGHAPAPVYRGGYAPAPVYRGYVPAPVYGYAPAPVYGYAPGWRGDAWRRWEWERHHAPHYGWRR